MGERETGSLVSLAGRRSAAVYKFYTPWGRCRPPRGVGSGSQE